MVNPNGYIQGTDGNPLELVDITARRQLAGKLDSPGSVKSGDYLRVQSVGADGTVVLEGAQGPGADSGQNPYELPIGGDELGGVKNGGNVIINNDGTMTAPDNAPSDEQVAGAIEDYLVRHPIDPNARIIHHAFSARFTEPGTVDSISDTYVSTPRMPVSEGDKIQYAGRVNGGSVCYIYDINGSEIWKSPKLSPARNDAGEVTVPAGGVYAKCMTMNSTHGSYAEHDQYMRVSGSVDTAALEAEVIGASGVGNASIQCVRELHYTDGTPPKIERYLLEAPATGRLFLSRNLVDKEYAFTFFGDSENYSFGVLPSGDIIAVRDSCSLVSGKDDSHRLNPFVFLASENYRVQHEVDFGDRIKPCGWLENCGFCPLPNGDALFCEYTRLTVATANVWKISGDPTNPDNWRVKKTWEVTATNNVSGFKHCHSVMHDPYTNFVYVSTGDDSTAAAIHCSMDDGETWTQVGESSEKYCRYLNLIFTETHIYWATDSYDQAEHWFFRATRNESGVLDFDTIEDVMNIPTVSALATYGIAYIPELEAALLLERCDATTTEMPIRLVDLSNDTLHTIATVKSATGKDCCLGFRTRFSEWNPVGGVVRVGFDIRQQKGGTSTYNTIAVFGNGGSAADGRLNTNNLALRVYKANDKFGLKFDSYFV